jgi:hypothetical protein
MRDKGLRSTRCKRGFGKGPPSPPKGSRTSVTQQCFTQSHDVPRRHKATEQALQELAREGTQRGFVDRMQTRAELYDLLDYDPRG